MAQIDRKRKRVEEEPAFPRGGASILTPLEHKQIQIEATRDVLFEHANSTEPKKRKIQPKGKGKKSTVNVGLEEENVRIEGLSYKVGSPPPNDCKWLI